MPTKQTRDRARRKRQEGKKSTTQAGEFIREEMKKFKRGSGTVRSRKQAIAIGLSEARREGIKLGVPKKRSASAATRKQARRDTDIASGRRRVSPARSRAARKAAITRARRYSRTRAR